MADKVRVTWQWRCLGTGREPCPTRGTGPKHNADSDRHVRETLHGVLVWGTPNAS